MPLTGWWRLLRFDSRRKGARHPCGGGRRRRAARRLVLERLESRLLLAGDQPVVTIEIDPARDVLTYRAWDDSGQVVDRLEIAGRGAEKTETGCPAEGSA